MSIISQFSSVFSGGSGDKLQAGLDLAKQVKELVDAHKAGQLSDELKNKAQGEAEDAIKTQAANLFDQHIGQPLSAKGVPDSIIQPARDKAIDQLVAISKEKYQQYQASKQA